MAFLKRNAKSGRRHPMAAVLVMAAGLVITGGGYAAATSVATPSSSVYTETQVEEGRKLFLANCASCHGSNAEGSAAAPSLIGVGAPSVDFQVGTGRMPGQASGPQLQKKPVQFTEEQTAAMAAYVDSLAPGPSVPTEQMLALDGNAENGGELFLSLIHI